MSIQNLLFSVVCAIVLVSYFNWPIRAIIYLSILPFLLFLNLDLTQTILGIILAVIIFKIEKKGAHKYLYLYLALLCFYVYYFRQQFYFDTSLINSINFQRGEHYNFTSNLLARFLHSKLDLYQSFVSNLNTVISPSAVFASGYYPGVDKYLPLAYLFPWDILGVLKELKAKIGLPFVGAVLVLVLLTGFSSDNKFLFSYPILYLLALSSAKARLELSAKSFYLFLVADLLYVIGYFYTLQFFKV